MSNKNVYISSPRQLIKISLKIKHVWHTTLHRVKKIKHRGICMRGEKNKVGRSVDSIRLSLSSDTYVQTLIIAPPHSNALATPLRPTPTTHRLSANDPQFATGSGLPYKYVHYSYHYATLLGLFI